MQVQDPNANDRSKVGHEWTNNLGTSIDDPQRTLRSALPHDSLRIPSLALEVSSEHFSSTRDSMAPSSVASSSSRPQGERESGASPSPGPSASPEHVKQEVTEPEIPKKQWICYCNQPAREYLCQNGRPENVGKNFYKCRTQTCKYWEWNESEEDAIKRKGGKAVKASTSIHNRKPYDRPKPAAVTRKCDCGQPALRLVAKNGMPHNIGRAFFKCRRSKCEFWVWEDGSLPFSEASQRRFNEWMDDQNGYCPYDDFDDPGDWDNDYDDVHESIFSFLF